MTNLHVDIVDVPGIGKALAVFDQNGDMLPCQRMVETHTELDCIQTVTVTFVVDGDRVRIGKETAGPS